MGGGVGWGGLGRSSPRIRKGTVRLSFDLNNCTKVSYFGPPIFYWSVTSLDRCDGIGPLLPIVLITTVYQQYMGDYTASFFLWGGDAIRKVCKYWIRLVLYDRNLSLLGCTQRFQRQEQSSVLFNSPRWDVDDLVLETPTPDY